MKKQMQQILKEERGFSIIETMVLLVLLMIVFASMFMLFGSASNAFDELLSRSQPEEQVVQSEDLRIELMDMVRDIGLKVEAGTLTEAEKGMMVVLNEKLSSFDGSELETQVITDFNALVSIPEDAVLREKVEKQLDDVEAHLLSQAPQQTLSTF